MSNIERFVLLSVAVIIGIVGCSRLPSPARPGPAVDAIPAQQASTGEQLQVDLADYVDNPSEQALSWAVTDGPGSIEDGLYTGVFNEVGAGHVGFRVSDNEGNSAEGEFMVAALYGYMAIVQSGNGLEVLDGGSAAILPMQPGSSVPLIYRELLPDGSLLYERMGGSSVDLFRYDHNEIVQIGESNGLNTVNDNHTPDGKIFFEQGTSSETGLYMWDPNGATTTLVASRPGMHNRNAFVHPPHVAYFEYGNNGQADLHYWEIGNNHTATAYSSPYSESIEAILPDGGIVFSTKGAGGEDELRYLRMGHGVFHVGGDLPPVVQEQDMKFVTTTSQGLVVFETGTASRDLWMWNAGGLTTNAVAATGADERFVAITEDDLVVYSIVKAPGDHDLKLYNYSANASTDVAVGPEDEVFELALSDSDVVFAVESVNGRSLHRFDAATNVVDTIAESAGDSYAVVAALTTDRLVYTGSGVAGGLFTWDPVSGAADLVGGPNAMYAGQAPDGGFVMHIMQSGQADLALWSSATGQVSTIAQTQQDEHFEAAFANGAVIFSAVVPPKTTSDLFQWQAGVTTRLTDGSSSHSVVRVLRGDV